MDYERRWHQNNVPAARSLRRPMTEAEAVLWAELRGRGLDGWKFRRQHPVGRFVVDFYCHQLKLAIEVDGAIHLARDVRAADEERQAILVEEGIRFLRVSNTDVLEHREEALARIRLACAEASSENPRINS